MKAFADALTSKCVVTAAILFSMSFSYAIITGKFAIWHAGVGARIRLTLYELLDKVTFLEDVQLEHHQWTCGSCLAHLRQLHSAHCGLHLQKFSS